MIGLGSLIGGVPYLGNLRTVCTTTKPSTCGSNLVLQQVFLGSASKPTRAGLKTPKRTSQAYVFKNLFRLCASPFSPILIGVLSVPLACKLGHYSDWNRHTTLQTMTPRP